jgi:phytoene synthase
MDLRRGDGLGANDGQSYDTYETFDDLYQYCYLVASVVGLVCIRIFGYRDLRAEKLAEETGIAFQLTNILRDVREDAERGRIYLPLEDLRRFGVTPEQLAQAHDEHGLTGPVRELLHWESLRAEEYYRSGEKLLPLIDADSRPALWVLITIYNRLLLKIKGLRYDVFSRRVSVPAYEKLAILGWGMVRTLGGRG